MNGIRFFKTRVFKQRATELDAWEDVDRLKKTIEADPTLGDVIKGGDGLRKVRMPLKSQGKGARGGARVIYFQVSTEGFILFVYMYAKNEASDLEADEVKELIKVRDEAVKEVRRKLKHAKKHLEGT